VLRTGSEESGYVVVATQSTTLHRQPTPAAHGGPAGASLPSPERLFFFYLQLAVGLSFWLSFLPCHTHAVTAAAADPTALQPPNPAYI
jgi:hypothetical protein